MYERVSFFFCERTYYNTRSRLVYFFVSARKHYTRIFENHFKIHILIQLSLLLKISYSDENRQKSQPLSAFRSVNTLLFFFFSGYISLPLSRSYLVVHFSIIYIQYPNNFCPAVLWFFVKAHSFSETISAYPSPQAPRPRAGEPMGSPLGNDARHCTHRLPASPIERWCRTP